VFDHELHVKKRSSFPPLTVVRNYVTVYQSILRNNPEDGKLGLFLELVALVMLKVTSYSPVEM
jgi:hypothetical protein